jgi:hypothetical protein
MELLSGQHREMNIVKIAMTLMLVCFGAAMIALPVSAANSGEFLITGDVQSYAILEIVPSGGSVSIGSLVMGSNEKTSGICTVNAQSNSPWKVTVVDSDPNVQGISGTAGRLKFFTSGSVPLVPTKTLTNPLNVKLTGGNYAPLSTTDNSAVTIYNGNATSGYSGNMAFQQNITSNDPATINGQYLWMKINVVASPAV